jgi:hypothetical protein
VIPAAEWALRIVSILDDQNLVSLFLAFEPVSNVANFFQTYVQGVALAVASLVLSLAQDNLEAYAVCYQKAVSRLSKVSFRFVSPLLKASQQIRSLLLDCVEERILKRLRLLQSASALATSQAASYSAVLSSLG